ncbi:MAG: carboxypeptidase regulatory-like domain-containing protein [Planctomycetes bacterium]|nr:carboxypeptidase regulatory-like domain-containing protein [Planctomycetota bacterium]
MIEGDRREPIPFARVGLSRGGNGGLDPGDLVGDATSLRRAASQLFAADAGGVARVPWPANVGSRDWLFAIEGERRGALRLDGTAGALVELELWPARAVSVRVVDASGAPAIGTPVRFGSRLHGEFQAALREVVTAPPDGVARLDGLDTLDRGWRSGSLAEWGVFVPSLHDPPFASVDPEAPPDEPVLLRLPAEVALEVVLRTATGQSYRGRGSISVYSFDAEGSIASERQQGASFVDGRARCAALPPSMPLLMQVEADGLAATIERRIVTPAIGEPPLLLEFEVEASIDGIEGRVVGEDGAAVVHAPLELELRSSMRVRRLRAESDEEGRFRFDAELRVAELLGSSFRLLRPDDRSRMASGALSEAAVEATLRLGDVVLRLRPLLVSGRVVDTQGKPIDSAAVAISFGRPLTEEEEASLDEPWPSTSSDQEGHFALFGAIDLASATVQASDGFGARRSPPIPFQSGATDVELCLPATGRLLGRLLLDPGVPLQGLQLCAAPSAGSDIDAQMQWAITLGDASFALLGLAPGDWDVELRLLTGGAPTRLASIERVSVTADGATLDPRLDPIDLRGRLHAATVTIVDGSGRPCRGALLRAFDGERGDLLLQCDGSGGVVRLSTDRSELRVEVAAPGFRAARLDSVRGERRVELSRSAVRPVTLRLPAPVATRYAELLLKFSLRLELRSMEAVGSAWPWLETEVDPDGSARFAAVEATRHAARATLFRRQDDSGSSAPRGVELEPEALSGFAIEGEAPLDVELPIGLAAFEAAIAQLTARDG